MDFDVARLQFERDGFAVVTGVADPEIVELAIAHCGQLRTTFGLSAEAPIVAAQSGDPVASSIADEARLAVLASTVLGVAASSFAFTYLCKPARRGLRAAWHQDGAPWAALLNGAPALTIWIALTDADESSGCLRAVPGSHRMPAQPLFPDERESSLFGVGMDRDLVDETQALSITVSAGDAVVHHPNLVHGSFANHSPRPQIALAIRYRGNEVSSR
jgi:phytanoyl-CoA hydroxylase